ncbi:MAG: phosphoserine phosphatase RsbU/P [Thermoplasmata archaeon]|nr:phosphoserine phosphatase RsbU/P [Thermoplasmata archaeon]
MSDDAELDILRGLSGAIVAVDDHGRITFASTTAQRLLGWGPELMGQPLLSIIPGRLQARHSEGFGRYSKTGESRLMGHTVRVPAQRKDGSEKELDLTIRVFRRPDGTKLVAAALSEAALGRPPPDLLVLESAFARRLYQLV